MVLKKGPPAPAAASYTTSSSPPPPRGPQPHNRTNSSQDVQSKMEPPSLTNPINDECERALTALHCGNHTEALKLTRDLCQNHPHLGLVHGIHASVLVEVASSHLKNALESAQQAVSLSPGSLDYAYLYATLLFVLTGDYEAIVRECNRVLAVDEHVLNNAEEKLAPECVAAARLLRPLIGLPKMQNGSDDRGGSSTQKEEILSGLVTVRGDEVHISPRVKNGDDVIAESDNGRGSSTQEGGISNGLITVHDDGVHVDPTVTITNGDDVIANGDNGRGSSTQDKQMPDDHIAVHSGGAHVGPTDGDGADAMPNAPSLDREPLSSDINGNDRLTEPSSSTANTSSVNNVVEKLRSYWNSLSDEKKRGSLEVRISDLKKYYCSLKNGLALGVLSEAIDFARENKNWKFWACCHCGEKFADKDLFLEHIIKEHEGIFWKKLQLMLPPRVRKNYQLTFQDSYVTSEPKKEENQNQGFDSIKERIVFTNDLSCLRLDQPHLLQGELIPGSFHDAVADDGSAVLSALNDHHEDNVQIDSDTFTSWLFACPTIEEQLTMWMQLREDKKRQGIGLSKLLEKEFQPFQSMCDRILEQLLYEKAFHAVTHICREELKKREQFPNLVRSYISLLRKRQEELVEMENNAMFSSSRIELDVINNILKEAQAVNADIFRLEETLTDEQRTQEFWMQADTCISTATWEQKHVLIVELDTYDARIKQTFAAVKQLKHKFESESAHDYRIIMLVLLQSFIKARLEYLLDKDATEKYDAATEAFLAELALDAKENTQEGEFTKQEREKSEDEKKREEKEKAKD